MPVTIIAEAGVNHNGDLEMAKKMARVAKECGADIVKYQTAVGAFFLTAHAAAAAIDIDGWFTAAVLITLAGT